jgi:hypothetical protein
MRDLGATLCCWVAAACSAEVGDLERVPPPAGEEDAGPRADAGIEVELDAGIAKAPEGCERGWIDIAAVGEEGAAITGTSFAAQPDAFAITWTERGAAGGEGTALIAFFDGTGRPRGGPIEVASRSRVIAYERGFLRSGDDGMERYDLTGASLEKARSGFFLLKMVGGRLWGLNSDNYVSITRPGPLAEMSPFAVGVEGSNRTMGFGPDRFVVADEPTSLDEPLVLHLYALEVRGAVEIQTVMLPSEIVDGERHLGHALAAAEWNDQDARFDLLIGMRLGPTRQFGARLMHLDDRGLSDGPALHLEPTSVAYEGLSGAIAFGERGTIALAYRSPYNASRLGLDLVRGQEVEHFPIEGGASYATKPLIERIGERFALVYGTGAESTSVFERVLQLRCDLESR